MNSDLNPIVTRKSTAAEKNSFQWSQNSLFLNPQNSLDLFPHPRPIPPPPRILHKLLFSNAPGRTVYSQEH